MDRPTASPARWPYREHRTIEQVDRAEMLDGIRAKAERMLEDGADPMAVDIALRNALRKAAA
jgi:hypothetical protein